MTLETFQMHTTMCFCMLMGPVAIASASPAVGYAHLHIEQQKALVDGAFARIKGFVLTR